MWGCGLQDGVWYTLSYTVVCTDSSFPPGSTCDPASEGQHLTCKLLRQPLQVRNYPVNHCAVGMQLLILIVLYYGVRDTPRCDKRDK